MAVAIRLKRHGRKHLPFYRIDAMEKSRARGGRSLETLGYYDPLVEDKKKKVHLKVDRVQHWLDRGARPSETVLSFLRSMEVKWGDPTKKSRKCLQRKRAKERIAKEGPDTKKKVKKKAAKKSTVKKKSTAKKKGTKKTTKK